MFAKDPFNGSVDNPIQSFDNLLEVTPSDSEELPFVATKLVVKPELDEANQKKLLTVCCITAGGQKIDLQTRGGSFGVPDGLSTVNVRVRQVLATGTTAQTIYAFW